MRPLVLEFQAFGSYPGKEVVDFAALGRRGLFVVTGPTGSGKTTVFDALAFALFGNLPGGRSADGVARSHFASSDDETYAQLVFEVDGERHTIRRSPSYERPKQRGSGTTLVQTSATLVRHSAGGAVTLASKANDCTKQVEALLGISAKHFQRVVLLPQGKFTDFLIATDEDREKLLRQLFGGELFERTTRHLKQEMESLSGQVRGVQIEVDNHRNNALAALREVANLWSDDDAEPDVPQADQPDVTLADIEGLLVGFEAQQGQRQQRLEALQNSQKDATTNFANARAEAKRFDDAARYADTIKQLNELRSEVERGREDALTSRDARPVATAAAALEAAERCADQASAAKASARTRVEELFAAASIEAPPFESAAVAKEATSRLSYVSQQRQLLRAATDAAAKANAAEEQLAAATKDFEEAQRALQESNIERDRLRARSDQLTPITSRLDTVRSELETAQNNVRLHQQLGEATAALARLESEAARAKRSYEDTLQGFVLTTAPRLAQELRQHEPCPVCGSCEHPSPAHTDGTELVDHDAVDAARKKWSQRDSAVADAIGEIKQLRFQLGESADLTEADLAGALTKAKAARSEVDAASCELEAVEGQLKQIEEELSEHADRASSASNRKAKLGGEAGATRGEADRLAEQAKDLDGDRLDADAATFELLEGIAADLDELFAADATAAGACDAARTSLGELLSASSFDSAESARLAVLDAASEAELLSRFEAWRGDLSTATTSLEVLQSDGVPQERPDLDQYAETAEQATGAAQQAMKTYTTATNAIVTCRSHIHSMGSALAGSSSLQQRYDTARKVFRTCNGEVGPKVKLERWVLAGELDRVSAAANVHLMRMTNNRFSLKRDTERRGGLGLLVSDAHTGRSRATASLSGGEQFQAALALALGLADVVSLGGLGTGRTFEALFVDEGFGSLDPDALDQAIEALTQLHATGRMVGAITHVEAMKHGLHVGIEVRRLADGGGSTLVVKP